jgi:Kef-type K+ transport system membrane component KefB
MPPVRLVVLLLLGTPACVFAAQGHDDPLPKVALGIAIVLVAAKLGGDGAVRTGQPAVLGELLAGVALGNLPSGYLAGLAGDPYLDLLAGLGALVLLFEVGLEATVSEMLGTGRTAVAVAVLGVIAPFVLGWIVGAALLPGESGYVHAFLGATLCATSVGITARVLRDLGRSQTREAHVILGAAVIDDVLGLVVLAVVTGIIAAADRGAPASYADAAVVLVKAAAFLGVALALGVWFSRRLFTVASRIQAHGALLAAGLALCFATSWLASALGLAPIVGAFAAGLVLEEVHFRDFVARGERSLDDLVRPIGELLVPIFFVTMGMRMDLAAFAQPGVLGLTAALTVAAIVGKQACGLGAGAGVDRVAVGLGMVPRGEVGLIFASIGLGLTLAGEPVIDPAVYAAVVAMVVVTTVVTPPALAWRLGRRV